MHVMTDRVARAHATHPATSGDHAPEPAGGGDPAGSVPPVSALTLALDRVGDRWSLLLIEALLPGSRRFGELGDAVTGIAPNILADRLRRLERAGIILATPYSNRPPRMEYALTADGLELAGALHLLADWGARRGGAGEPIRHEVCGTPLEARWYCATCERLVAEDEPETLARL
jgi:DNA-binding HxlR family transcriptional regulator